MEEDDDDDVILTLHSIILHSKAFSTSNKHICNTLCKADISSSSYMQNIFFYTSGLQPDDVFVGVSETCDWNLQLVQ